MSAQPCKAIELRAERLRSHEAVSEVVCSPLSSCTRPSGIGGLWALTFTLALLGKAKACTSSYNFHTQIQTALEGRAQQPSRLARALRV